MCSMPGIASKLAAQKSESWSVSRSSTTPGQKLGTDCSGDHGNVEQADPLSEPYFTLGTFSHRPLLPDLRTVSQIYCVSKASRNVGLAGLLEATPWRKSAT